MNRPLIISGPPRSGTSWVGEILSSGQLISYLFEPDNEKISPLAWLLKQQIHRFPYLTAGSEARGFNTLWEIALDHWPGRHPIYMFLEKYFRLQTGKVEGHIGNKTGFTYIDDEYHGVSRAGKQVPFDVKHHMLFATLAKSFSGSMRSHSNDNETRLIVKTVHSLLALDWLTSNFDADVLIVLRNPYSLYASYKRLRMPDGYRNLWSQTRLWDDLILSRNEILCSATTIADIWALQISLILRVLEKSIAAHPEWQIVSHDRLCIDPVKEFEQVFHRVNLQWSEMAENTLDARNRAGEGFAPNRMTRSQPTKWKEELDQAEVDTVEKWVSLFRVADFLEQYVY